MLKFRFKSNISITQIWINTTSVLFSDSNLCTSILTCNIYCEVRDSWLHHTLLLELLVYKCETFTGVYKCWWSECTYFMDWNKKEQSDDTVQTNTCISCSCPKDVSNVWNGLYLCPIVKNSKLLLPNLHYKNRPVRAILQQMLWQSPTDVREQAVFTRHNFLTTA